MEGNINTQLPVAKEPREWNPLAIASFTLSILVFVLYFVVGFPIFAIAFQAFGSFDYSADLIQLLAGAVQVISSLSAIVLGAVAIDQIKRSGGRQKGIGFAIAGIALQAIIYFLFLCAILIFLTTWWYYTYLHQ
jgi:hypothetical protein